MIFSHISDTHLGLMQYGSEEREDDVYHSFNQAIDISIKDHVDFVIFAGDIFHVPNPNGNAIIQMANALKKLQQNNIESFFILGEHDISRIRTTPIPFVYHQLGVSRYIGGGEPFEFNNTLIVGFDKRRRSEVSQLEEKFADLDSVAKNHSGHKLLVMHQGITEFNKYAGELNSTDLPKNFTYYAMGHLHDADLSNFDHLKGPIAYPGSTELTTSEGIKDTKKGFYEVDISTPVAKTEWIQLDTRPQLSFKMDCQDVAKSVDEIISKISEFERRPVIDIRIKGNKVETDIIQAQLSRLNELTLRYFWRIFEDESDSSVFFEKPSSIDDELFKLSLNALGSEKLATLAIKELLPQLASNNVSEATQIILEHYEEYKKGQIK